jgi:hypothetical protein
MLDDGLDGRFFDASAGQFYSDVLAHLELFRSHSGGSLAQQFRVVGRDASEGTCYVSFFKRVFAEARYHSQEERFSLDLFDGKIKEKLRQYPPKPNRLPRIKIYAKRHLNSLSITSGPYSKTNC